MIIYYSFLVFLLVETVRECLIADRKSTRLNSSHSQISYAVFCLKKKKRNTVHRGHFIVDVLYTKVIGVLDSNVPLSTAVVGVRLHPYSWTLITLCKYLVAT